MSAPAVPNPHQQNVELMRRMGSAQGYDPIPPSQYLAFLQDRDPRQRLLAWVRSKTLRQKHRSQFCVDSRGRPLTLKHAQADLHIDWGFLYRTWSQLESAGFVRRDPDDGRLYLRGDVPVPEWSEEKENKAEEFDCTVKLPSYLSKQFQRLSENDQQRFQTVWQSLENYAAELEADAIAAARAVRAELEARVLAGFGMERRNGKTVPRRDLVQLELRTAPPPELAPAVQSSNLSVHGETTGLYTAEIEPVQSSGPIQSAENFLTAAENPSSSSSSLSASVKLPLTTTTTAPVPEPAPEPEPASDPPDPGEPGNEPEDGMSDPAFAQGLHAAFADLGAPTDRQIRAVSRQIPPPDRGDYLDRLGRKISAGEIRHAGVLATDAPLYMRGRTAAARTRAPVPEPRCWSCGVTLSGSIDGLCFACYGERKGPRAEPST